MKKYSDIDANGCPKCLNRIGFVFGTCGDCGWNYLDDTYHWIVVRAEQGYSMIDLVEHDNRIRQRRLDREYRRQKDENT